MLESPYTVFTGSVTVMLGHLVSTRVYTGVPQRRPSFSWVWRLIALFFRHH